MGTRAWKAVRARRLTPQAVAKVKRRARAEVDALTLRELRLELDVTQVELAGLTAMTQSELSRLEKRSDHRVSTVRRYVEALGGEIEITAVIGKRRIRLTDV